MRVIVVDHLSLDGVLQAPARPDEDPRGGFEHGGWALARGGDPLLARAMSARMGAGFEWLLGRRTYDDLLAHWNEAGGPFKDGLNATTKHVVTSDPDLPWPHSVQVTGDVAAEVARLRARPGGNLVVMGSARLTHALLAAGQVDELFVMIHPVVLGSGTRLFAASDQPIRLTLVEAQTTADGVVAATYEVARDS